jgi:gas vesicle protein
MSDQDTNFGSFLIGFLVGGLVGAAVALLFAPQSGLETRAYIRDKSIELKDKAVETTDQAMAEARLRADAAMAELRARTDEIAKLTKRQKVLLEEQEALEKEAGAAEAGV